MEAFAERAGARKLLNTEATPEMIRAENYDAVILAVGADPIMPKVPGWDRPNVFWAPDAENGKAGCGENVVIIGASSVGTEASINLAMQGKNVTVLDMANEVSLRSTGAEYDLLQLSERYGVRRLLGWKLVEIGDGRVTAENVNSGETRDFPADTVLMAVGMKPRLSEALRFYHCCPETNFFMVGDCGGGGDIRDAVKTAFDAARYI
jgi:NADPH-dependent 2,4-dienoyl-CoA reductase/sulfur reductase-like enzyme